MQDAMQDEMKDQWKMTTVENMDENGKNGSKNTITIIYFSF